jgi:hypothetical protein
MDDVVLPVIGTPLPAALVMAAEVRVDAGLVRRAGRPCGLPRWWGMVQLLEPSFMTTLG